MKRIFLVLSVVFLILVVAACKKEPEETTTKPKTTTTAAQTTAPAGTTQPVETTTEDILKKYPGYELANYSNINLKFAPTEVRNIFFRAAEYYLLETMHGGIPVFSNSGYQMYNPRIQLFSDSYIPVMGFGTSFSDIMAVEGTVGDADDSNTGFNGEPIEFSGGGTGNPGEKTYRSSLAQGPTTFHHWLYDDSTSQDVITLFLNAPYVYRFNEAKTGYKLVPGMAADFPYTKDEEGNVVKADLTDEGVLEEGADLLISKKWYIDISDDLVWTYHESTLEKYGHLLELDENDTRKITAEDFVETYKLALEEGWFRAISGGGDFFNPGHRIVNAEAFYDGKVPWEEVGIKYIPNDREGVAGTIEFEFENDMSEWNVRYWLASFVMGPVDLKLYDVLKPADPTRQHPYGTSVETTAYNGPFKLLHYQQDKLVKYEANPYYNRKDDYKFTHWHYAIIKDAEVRWQEFLDGKLDAASLPSTAYDDYKEDPRIKFVPGSTTFRIMINGLGTPEKQKEKFPESNWEPKPLLANHNFKRAMYFVIDRRVLAWEIMKTSTPQMYHFTDAYLVDALSGIPFRNSPEADPAWYDEKGLSTETHGFSKDAAIAWWKAAVDELFEQGYYKEGDVVELDFLVFSGSQSQIDMGEFIQQSFEETFNKTNANHDLSVKVNVKPTEFPDIYYNYMMAGNFDISIGGISGSALDAAGFLDVYCDDNRGGFTLNWGINTSKAEIPVEYRWDPETQEWLDEDEVIKEIWSFNAIVAALNGTTTVRDGEEVFPPKISLGDAFKARYTDSQGRITIDIPKGNSLNINDVKAIDPRDGDITDKIDITIEKFNHAENKYEKVENIDFDNLGRYRVTYNVENENKVKDEVVIYVNIKESKPEFVIGDNKIYFDPADGKYHLYLELQDIIGVYYDIRQIPITAKDLKDGDVTISIAIIYLDKEGKEQRLYINEEQDDLDEILAELNLVKINVLGDYELKYEVKNEAGVTTTMTLVVHVVEELPALDIVFDPEYYDFPADYYDGLVEGENGVHYIEIQKGTEFTPNFVSAIGQDTELVPDLDENGLEQYDEYEQVIYKVANKDYTANIEISYSGEIDTNVVGTYVVTYKVTNIYGVETVEYLVIRVVE